MFRRAASAILAIAAAALLASSAAPLLAVDAYAIDKNHSDVSFQVRHFASKVRGRFSDFSGTIQADTAKPEASSVEFTIKTASVDTGNADRDNHLRTPDFFDAAKNPEITFKSSKITPTGKDKFDVAGDAHDARGLQAGHAPRRVPGLGEGSRAATSGRASSSPPS